MQYRALTTGLPDGLFFSLQTQLASKNLRFTPSLGVQDASLLLIQQVFHLLIVDLEHLRSIRQTNWLAEIRRTSFVPVIVLSDTPEDDVRGMVQLGADMCISSKRRS